jgi:pyridoxamine 5'-phosphate oxidase
MSDRSGIFAGDDPFDIARRWMGEAVKAELNDPDAAALASVDPDGLPDVRVVLVREIGAGTLTFFTNYESAKGRELLSSGKAALNFHWKSLRRQMRFRGTVIKATSEVSDAYFQSRHPVSRLGTWASDQSRPLKDRAELEQKLETVRAQFGDNASRPPYWGGFALLPTQIELWSDGPNRLHDRFRWVRSTETGDWAVNRLYP